MERILANSAAGAGFTRMTSNRFGRADRHPGPIKRPTVVTPPPCKNTAEATGTDGAIARDRKQKGNSTNSGFVEYPHLKAQLTQPDAELIQVVISEINSGNYCRN
jgi:hypothetical protein